MDEQLKILIKLIVNAPIGSQERANATSRLIGKLSHIPQLQNQSDPHFADAINQTWEWVAKNIQNFDLSKSNVEGATLQQALVNWIKTHLRYRIKELRHQRSRKKSESERKYEDHTLVRTLVGEVVSVGEETLGTGHINLLDQQASTDITVYTLNGIDLLIEKEQQKDLKRIGLAIRQFIEQDLNKILQNCHLKEHSECNCQMLLKRLFLQETPDKLTNIAREKNVNNQSLNSHLKRKCLPILQEFITNNLGYQPHQQP